VGFAGIVGPILGAQVFDRFGDYRYAFYASGVLAVVALVALAGATRPRVARFDAANAAL
jgi:MFS family permease